VQPSEGFVAGPVRPVGVDPAQVAVSAFGVHGAPAQWC
jgi:hypothetical protein